MTTKIETQLRQTSYISLKVNKENTPVEISDYAKTNNVDKKSAFSW